MSNIPLVSSLNLGLKHRKENKNMATLDEIRYLIELGSLKGDYRDYRHLKGKTKYKVKG